LKIELSKWEPKIFDGATQNKGTEGFDVKGFSKSKKRDVAL
jgi:hypothetical protein